MSNENGAPEKTTTTIEIDKELFLKFKALCVLRELKISGEIEKLINSWVGGKGTDVAATNPNQKKLSSITQTKGKQTLTDNSLDNAEKTEG